MKLTTFALVAVLFMALLLSGEMSTRTQAALSPSAVQDANTQVCNVAFSQGIRDNYYVLSEREQFTLYQQRLCSANFSSYQAFRDSSASLGLDVITGEGMLGLTGTNEQKASVFSQKYQSFCSDTYFNNQNQQRYQSYISQVNSALTNNWQRCVEAHLAAWLNTHGVFASVSPFDSFSGFVVQVKVKTPMAQPVVITALHPVGAVTCSRVAGQSLVVPSQPINNTEFSLTCAKNPNVQVPFAIETNLGQSQTVTVPAVTSKLSEINEKLIALQGTLNALTGSISQVNTSLGQRVTDLDNKVNNRTAANWKECQTVGVGQNKTHGTDAGDWCPNGWYIVKLDFNGSPELHVGTATCCRPVP